MQFRKWGRGPQQLQRGDLAHIDAVLRPLESLPREDHGNAARRRNVDQAKTRVENLLDPRVHRRVRVEVRDHQVDDDQSGSGAEAKGAGESRALIVRFSRAHGYRTLEMRRSIAMSTELATAAKAMRSSASDMINSTLFTPSAFISRKPSPRLEPNISLITVPSSVTEKPMRSPVKISGNAAGSSTVRMRVDADKP